MRWSSRWAAGTRCVNLLLASNPPCSFQSDSFRPVENLSGAEMVRGLCLLLSPVVAFVAPLGEWAPPLILARAVCVWVAALASGCPSNDEHYEPR